LGQRLRWLTLLLAAEWLPISAAVHTGRGGAVVARLVIAFSAFFLILGHSRVRVVLPQVSLDLQSKPIGWAWLQAHAVALSVFLALSLLPPLQTLSGSPVLWYASGIGAIALAILAFIPPSAASQLVRRTGPSWIFALIAAAAAWRLAAVSWSLWNTTNGRALTTVTFDFIHLLLSIVFPNVVANRAKLSIGTSRFAVQIGDACSGFEGLGLVLIFGLLWLWFFREEIRFPQALWSLPAGLLPMWILNAVRIVLLISIGHFGAERIALGGFHSQAGWIAFSGVTLAYAAALQHFRWFSKTSVRPAAAENRAAVFLVPFMAILAAALLTHAASAGFEWSYPLRFIAACSALWLWRGSYKALNRSLSWTGPVVGVAVAVLWIALERVLHPAADTAMPAALAGATVAARTAWIAVRALAAATTVPIAEELAFRGFLLRRLMAEDFESVEPGRFTWPALLLSSVAFGALHGSRWIAGTLAGLLYGLAMTHKGKLGDAVIAHATTNAILAVYVLLFNRWQLW